VVSALRRLGLDVVTVLDVNRAGIRDDDQLRFATSLGRVFYSLNARHFARLHREFVARGEEHAGTIVIPRQGYTIGEKVRRLRQLLDTLDVDTMTNQIYFL
jgi:hypothetical protein